jgi:hypothetical protein
MATGNTTEPRNELTTSALSVCAFLLALALVVVVAARVLTPLPEAANVEWLVGP